MPAPFYTANDVALAFDVTDDVGAVNPTSANVSVYLNGTQLVTDDTAVVTTNRVSYTVQDTITTSAGTYVAEFDVILPSGDIRSHIITFSVIVRPIT